MTTRKKPPTKTDATPEAPSPAAAIENSDLMRLALTKSRSLVARSEAKAAELELRLVIQDLYLRYGLGMEDSIDETNGAITRKQQ